MSILGIEKNQTCWKLRKTALIYLIGSMGTILVNWIYGMFGHGVSSAAMTWMFLYPLVGGALFFLLLDLIVPKVSGKEKYRLFYLLHHFGIVTMTAGSFLQGVFEIAGTSSIYTKFFYGAGAMFFIAGLMVLVFRLIPFAIVDAGKNGTT